MEKASVLNEQMRNATSAYADGSFIVGSNVTSDCSCTVSGMLLWQ